MEMGECNELYENQNDQLQPIKMISFTKMQKRKKKKKKDFVIVVMRSMSLTINIKENNIYFFKWS